MSASRGIVRNVGESWKASWRFVCRPILPIFPAALLNRLPFLGRVCIHGPQNLRLHFHTYGPRGKDRIAIKLARRGFWSYEGETTRVFLLLVQQAHSVIDVGANTGLFAMLAGGANPNCRVWAFEPVPFVFDMLQKNVLLNRLSNVDVIPCAASDATGETTFYVTQTSEGIPTDSSSCAGFRDQVEAIRVATITLDQFAHQNQLPRLDVLKIDAETAESKVLAGAARTIATHRPFVICEVLENVDHAAVQQMMQSLDFRFFHIGPNGLERHEQLQGSLAVDQRNYLLAPSEKVPLLLELCAKAALSVAA